MCNVQNVEDCSNVEIIMASSPAPFSQKLFVILISLGVVEVIDTSIGVGGTLVKAGQGKVGPLIWNWM